MRQSELVELADITYRQLDYWTRTGYVHADGSASGSGKPRQWDEHEVAVTVLLARLVRSGLDPSRSADIARQVIEGGTGSHELAPGVVLQVTAQ